MTVSKNVSEYPYPVALALGFFDCVHRGHAALLRQTVRLAHAHKAKAAVFTFCNDPHRALGQDVPLIFSFAERCDLFAAADMESVCAVPFDAAYRKTSPKAFLDGLTAGGNVRAFVCGYDFRFGADRAGDTAFLQSYCRDKGIDCAVMPSFTDGGERVSSTKIRACLQAGDIERAEAYMGHPYFADGVVRHGRGVGHIYGYPTANLQTAADKLLPQEGVYATVAAVDGTRYRSVTNVGGKPTFDITESTVEVLLQNFAGDLYGKTVRLEFVRKLRDTRKFASPQALRAQIESDITWE